MYCLLSIKITHPTENHLVARLENDFWLKYDSWKSFCHFFNDEFIHFQSNFRSSQRFSKKNGVLFEEMHRNHLEEDDFSLKIDWKFWDLMRNHWIRSWPIYVEKSGKNFTTSRFFSYFFRRSSTISRSRHSGTPYDKSAQIFKHKFLNR